MPSGQPRTSFAYANQNDATRRAEKLAISGNRSDQLAAGVNLVVPNPLTINKKMVEPAGIEPATSTMPL